MIPLRVENPSARFPFVTMIIISLNIVVFTYQLSLGTSEDIFIWKYSAVAKTLTTFIPVNSASTLFPPLTLITSLFLHGDSLHLLGNMLFLWVFAGNVEDKLGYIRFLLFYILCGILSTAAQVATAPSSAFPMLGASGAIAGVMGAYFLRFPRTRVRTLIIVFFFIRVVRLPALLFLGIWFIFQILVGAPTIGSAQGGVAYFAHIGGFLCGIILFNVMEKYK